MIHVHELPFAGRGDELRALHTFCSATTQGDRLAALWIEGEAGIGKSRLITEALRSYTQDPYRSETIILETRLYQDSTVSPGWLVADALQTNPHAQQLLTEPVEPDLDIAVRAIRRLARLRPTILVLDDLHWLTGTGSEELARFLHSLREQPLAVLCTSRPGRHEGYTAMAGFIAGTLQIPPLTANDMQTILSRASLPINDGNHSLPEFLHTASHGIPLVLPSLLGELAETGNPHVTGETLAARVADISGRTRESIVAGLLNGLGEQERKAAGMLAALGALFTTQAAEILLGAKATAQTLNQLHACRILVHPLKPVSPLLGETEPPENTWTFAHSLLHETLLANSAVHEEQLSALILSRAAIHSITPFLLLLDRMPAEDTATTDLRGILETAGRLIRRAHVSAATQLLDRSEEAVRRWEGDLPGDTLLLIADLRINIASVHPFSAECQQAIRKALELTEQPQTEEQAQIRLRTLAYDIPSGRTDVFRSVTERMRETERLTQRFPSLLQSTELSTLLGLMAGQARIHPHAEHLREFTGYFRKIDALLSGENGDRQNRTGLYLFGLTLLPLFSSAGELEERRLLARDILEWFGGNLPEQLRHNYVRFLTNAGLVEEARDYLNQLPRGFGRLLSATYSLLLQKVFLDAALGAPLPFLERQLRGIIARSHQEFSSSPHRDEHTFPEIGAALCALTIGRMRGEESWGERLARETAGTDARVQEQMQLNALAHLKPDEHRSLPARSLLPEPLVPMFDLLERDTPAHREQVRKLLGTPPVHIDQVFTVTTSVTLLLTHHSSQTNELLIESFRGQAEEAISRLLIWAQEHSLVGFIPHILEVGKSLLSRSAAQRHATLGREKQELLAEKYGWAGGQHPHRERIALTMIGTITTLHGENGRQRIQGGKARRTLGLMTANELIRRPLPMDVFREIATGIAPHQGDPANALRQIVSRLRSLLGKDAIISDGQSPPRLNFDVVTVDLIRAWNDLDEAKECLRRRQPGNARNKLTAILRALGNEPVYPGLYGEFFDSAREEFEIVLREQILITSRVLVREGDTEGATVLLNHAAELMPGDEEIAEELMILFNRLGRPTEEFRIRQRWSRESETKEAA